jgi:hypothetical protein
MMTMVGKAIWGAVLLAVPGVAHADMTAVYGMTNGTMPFLTLEIAANGDIHGTMMTGNVAFIVQHDGHAFTILKTPDGTTVVSRVEDIATAMTEQAAKLSPDLREQMAKHAADVKLVLNGTQTINGRTGDAYFMTLADGKSADQPWAVISHDPKLAPLATAMAGQFEMSMKLLGPMLPTAAFQPMLDILHKGAPLMMTGMTLQSVSDAPIPASEFVLTAAPQTLDQVRARVASGGMKTGV